MVMKRSKRSVLMHSPSSSTPSCFRHAYGPPTQTPTFSNLALHRDSDTDTSADHSVLQSSPVLSLTRLSAIHCSPLDVNMEKANGQIGVNTEVSPDVQAAVVDISDRALGKSSLGEYLQHSISYARHMEHRGLQLSNRISQSSNISMSPRLLFTSDNSGNLTDSVQEHKKRHSRIDDVNMQSYFNISQQTVSTVERFARYSEVCPEEMDRRTLNRFVTDTPTKTICDGTSKNLNPIFNCTVLAGTFSQLEEISRTHLAVLYKARHRISGVIHCLKRSRCEFELERLHGSSSGEMSNEVQALSVLQHPNIIRYYSSWYEADSVYIQLEYCLGGSLFHYLHPNRQHDTSGFVASRHASGDGPDFQLGTNTTKQHPTALLVSSDTSGEWDQRRQLCEQSLILLTTQLVSALHYMHSEWSIVHGDVKPSNVLIQLRRPEVHLAASKVPPETDIRRHCYDVLGSGETKSICFKLADFGRSSRTDEDRDGEDLGDGRYLPKLDDPSPPVRAATGRDIYALGITLYHAAGGSMSGSAWDHLRETATLPCSPTLPASLFPLVNLLIRPHAQDRPTTSDLIAHPFIQPLLSDSRPPPIGDV